MDKHFLEFWGNFLLSAAKGQRQLEEMAKWLNQGFSGFEDLNAMFRKFYGLDRLTEKSPDYLKTWEKAEADFRESLVDYLSLFGVVPREVHLMLVEKYEKLKKKVAAQEETIGHLRMLLQEKEVDQAKVVSGLQKLTVEQGEQFGKLVKSFAEFYKKDKNQS